MYCILYCLVTCRTTIILFKTIKKIFRICLFSLLYWTYTQQINVLNGLAQQSSKHAESKYDKKQITGRTSDKLELTQKNCATDYQTELVSPTSLLAELQVSFLPDYLKNNWQPHTRTNFLDRVNRCSGQEAEVGGNQVDLFSLKGQKRKQSD